MTHGERRESCPVAARPFQGIAEGAMESENFWREREERFLKLAAIDGALDLTASLVEVDLPAYIEDLSTRVRETVLDHSDPIELIYDRVVRAAHAGRFLLDGERQQRWLVSGGPNNEQTRRNFQNKFRAEAMMAAVGAGEADATTTEEATLEAWLDLIVRTEPNRLRYHTLEHLAQVSADTCNHLASRAYREGRAANRRLDAPLAGRTDCEVVAPVDAPPKPEVASFPNRGVWLRKKMSEKRMTANRIHDLEGPDKATTARILSGFPVQALSLVKLAAALQVNVADIPND